MINSRDGDGPVERVFVRDGGSCGGFEGVVVIDQREHICEVVTDMKVCTG